MEVMELKPPVKDDTAIRLLLGCQTNIKSIVDVDCRESFVSHHERQLVSHQVVRVNIVHPEHRTLCALVISSYPETSPSCGSLIFELLLNLRGVLIVETNEQAWINIVVTKNHRLHTFAIRYYGSPEAVTFDSFLKNTVSVFIKILAKDGTLVVLGCAIARK